MSDFIKNLENTITPIEVKRIKAFIDWSTNERSLDEKLVTAVIEQMDADSFLLYAGDISSHGISGGQNGFTYYSDTTDFYEKNSEIIINWAKEYNLSLGLHNSFLAMLASAKIMQDNDFTVDDIAELIYSKNSELENYTSFANNMAWIVAEEICNAYTDFCEEYEDEEEGQ